VQSLQGKVPQNAEISRRRIASEKVGDDAVGGGGGLRSRSTVVPSQRGCVLNQLRSNRAGWFNAEVRILPPSQTVHLTSVNFL